MVETYNKVHMYMYDDDDALVILNRQGTYFLGHPVYFPLAMGPTHIPYVNILYMRYSDITEMSIEPHRHVGRILKFEHNMVS